MCCAGTPAIHPQGQTRRQRHETHESECVRPTRETAVQLRNIHDRLIAQGRDKTEEGETKEKKALIRRRRRWMENEAGTLLTIGTKKKKKEKQPAAQSSRESSDRSV